MRFNDEGVMEDVCWVWLGSKDALVYQDAAAVHQ